jgi:hypothetical protein
MADGTGTLSFVSSVDPAKDPNGWLESKLPAGWDWQKPDYDAIYLQRIGLLDYARKTPGAVDALLKHYSRPYGFYDFIYDWGVINDPRNAGLGMETAIPFVLFPRQVELLTWFQSLVEAPAKGLSGKGNVSKTRGCGASTLICFFYIWYWRFRARMEMGLGSNLERNVYDANNPKALFWKLENALKGLPEEFMPKGFEFSKHMQKGGGAGKLVNPENGSIISGDAGTEIGRGDRKFMYAIDEHAGLQFPYAAEAALASVTNTLIRISSEKRDTLFRTQVIGLEATNPANLFTFDWWQDPRMTKERFERDKAEAQAQGMGDIFRLEVERDPDAISVDSWLKRDLLEAAAKLDPPPSGPAIITIDVAAMGNDSSVIGWRRGLKSYELRKTARSSDDGQQLGREVTLLAEDILHQNVPIAAIIYELEGPGYAMHSVLMAGGLRDVLRPIHPGKKLSNGRHFNVRAQAWDMWKRALENGASIPPDKAIIALGSSLRYEWRTDSKGKKVLLMEDKKAFKKRLSADPQNNPMGGPSPDEADNCALSWLPVEHGELALNDYLRALGRSDDDEAIVAAWGWQ